MVDTSVHAFKSPTNRNRVENVQSVSPDNPINRLTEGK